jgi:hypothetical protein
VKEDFYFLSLKIITIFEKKTDHHRHEAEKEALERSDGNFTGVRQ